MSKVSVLDFFKAKQEAYISPMGVNAMLEQDPGSLHIVDVRIGPVPTRIPWALIMPEPDVLERIETLPKDKLLVLYCWDTWCSLATKAAIPLLENKYRVKELYGGIAAWETMGFPVVKADETITA